MEFTSADTGRNDFRLGLVGPRVNDIAIISKGTDINKKGSRRYRIVDSTMTELHIIPEDDPDSLPSKLFRDGEYWSVFGTSEHFNVEFEPDVLPDEIKIYIVFTLYDEGMTGFGSKLTEDDIRVLGEKVPILIEVFKEFVGKNKTSAGFPELEFPTEYFIKESFAQQPRSQSAIKSAAKK